MTTQLSLALSLMDDVDLRFGVCKCIFEHELRNFCKIIVLSRCDVCQTIDRVQCTPKVEKNDQLLLLR
jgi:hypothetical protein